MFEHAETSHPLCSSSAILAERIYHHAFGMEIKLLCHVRMWVTIAVNEPIFRIAIGHGQFVLNLLGSVYYYSIEMVVPTI